MTGKRVARGDVNPSPTSKVSVLDTLTEALRLVDEAEAIALLIEAYLVETGPTIVHSAARLLARTSRQLARQLCVLVDHDDAQRQRRHRGRGARR